MSLQGSLQHIQLHDVIQLVSVSGKSGIFHLKKGTENGKIYLKNGNIVHAEQGTIKGEEAIYTLAVWSEGEFFFEADIEPTEETIKKSNTNLLMEAARRMDEWKILKKKIPSTDMIPEFKPQPLSSKAHIHLNTGEWLILSKINGSNAIDVIAKESNLSIFDVCKILYGLITNNLIHLKETSHPQQQQEPVVSEASQAESVSGSAEEAKPVKSRTSPVPPQAPSPKAEITFDDLPTEEIGELTEPSTQSAETAQQLDAPKKDDKEKLLTILEKIKEISEQILGNQGKSIISKQYEKGLQDIENGKGIEAIKEVITHIARATSILKGPSTTEMLLEQIKTLKIS